MVGSVEIVRQQQERLRRNKGTHRKYVSRKRTTVANSIAISREAILQNGTGDQWKGLEKK